ncbi:MAG: glycosyltransferase family 4 protein [Alphaproteobacteria bacterium]|nr:glycosyltransferase family 4 protein [Alphaproteobacteria bacterium]MBU1516454.1 glycosyltransferase family 4 protein [Alphaproteobacteria bacterium]MBU2094211.1 glycosyltransferase family 4 protein [Alphaproteobacteria bacterium]MBU2154212.1 glycosyltransferase family 4 protein [Alphaproteobacteria bacterium]MBU2307381.1 glycosyltransferase family 4 protein [Alphaproteobacteria bacterium]
MANAAILLSAEPYDAAIPRPMGRNSAGEGFLRGFLAYADVDRFVFWNAYDRDQAELEALLERLGKPDRPAEWLGRADRAALAQVGALYIPTPELQGEAWARRAFGGHAYSLTGVTHTIAETPLLDEIAALLSAPIEPWDALICPSEAVRQAVEALLESVGLHLQDRFGATRIPPAQLVTIPLGVHTDDFRTDAATRRRWRETLDIPDDAPVALFLGRLSVATKMHPGPMGLALQEASQRLGQTVYWIVYGNAHNPLAEQDFREAAAAFCPDVELRFVEHASLATRDEIVSAADVFLSLSDNVQETFGLTPIEAMAAGLPCVVSDWDGYRDTVRHGVDGFRIRTTAPRPGLGSDLIYAYAQRLMSYDDYVGSAALLTAVDVADAAEALATLFADPDLRRRMGQAGQARAREVFDWRVVIPQYQALWAELERRRIAAPRQPALENPYRPDPFRMFAGYPTAVLGRDDMVALAQPFDAAESAERMSRAFVRNDAARLPSVEEAVALLARLAAGPRPVAVLLAETPPERRPFVERGIVWLAKFGFVRLRGGTSRT